MRLHKFIIVLLLVTILALFYVWQQTEIIKLAYDGQQKSRAYRSMLDKNYILMYNLAILKSSQNLGQKVFIDNSEFQMPEAKQVVELKYVALNTINPASKQKKNILTRLFDFGLRAEAKPVK